MDQASELPPGFREVTAADSMMLRVTNQDLPWLKDKDNSAVRLAKVILKNGSGFYLGSAVRGKLTGLVENNFRHNPELNAEANSLFYSRLPGFVGNEWGDIRTIRHPVSQRQIYYVANKGGIRVYFMRFENQGKYPVIVRIAACANKRQEYDLIRVITTDDKL